MKATVAELAWLAGFMDGEGTIGVSRCNSKNWPTPYLRPHFQVPNTDRNLIDHAASIIEKATGKYPNITVSNKGDAKNKKAWRIKVSTQWELLILIPTLLPYLVSKKRQSELVLEFCSRKASRNRVSRHYKWYEFKEQDEAAYHECLALNRRGPERKDIEDAKVVPLRKEA